MGCETKWSRSIALLWELEGQDGEGLEGVLPNGNAVRESEETDGEELVSKERLRLRPILEVELR
jgi:hypothetical protein